MKNKKRIITDWNGTRAGWIKYQKHLADVIEEKERENSRAIAVWHYTIKARAVWAARRKNPAMA